MLKEYAVEPAAMGSSWETFRYLIGLLTFEQGRRISKFPRTWEREVITTARAANITPIRLQSIVERLRSAGTKGSIVDFNRRYDSSLGNWLTNALTEHRRLAFHAIIATGNPANENAVVVIDDATDEHRLIQSAHTWEVQRTGAAIAAAVVPLMRSAREILIVDPYLDWRDVVTATGYRSTLGEILRALHAWGRRNVTVQLHFRTHDSRPPSNVIIKDARKLLRGLLPQTFSFELHEWQERDDGEDFHDRHVLCDCGGLSIGAGFEAVGGHQHAEVSLKPFDLSRTLKARFTVGTAAFDLVGNVIVIDALGTAIARKAK